MYASKSRWILGAVIVLALAFPALAEAHAGGGTGHGGMGGGSMGGGMGHGGMGRGGMGGGMSTGMGTGMGHGHHNHWNGWWGWSWGVPWDWYGGYNYPSWDNGDSAWQQGYNAAIQQANLSAYQERQRELRLQRQAQAPERAAKVQPQRQPAAAPVSATPEQRAAGKLKLAMLLAAEGKTGDAAEFLTDIVSKYPNTPAAAQAQANLNKLTGGNGGR